MVNVLALTFLEFLSEGVSVYYRVVYEDGDEEDLLSSQVSFAFV
jgi:hypothetical protein